MPPLAHRLHIFRRKQRSLLEQTQHPFPDLGLHLRNGFRRYDRLVKPKRFIFGTEHAVDHTAVEMNVPIQGRAEPNR